MNTRHFTAISIVVSAVAAAPGQTPLSNAFTYQGRLENAGNPASGFHDLRFRLYDAPTGGALVGATLCADNVNLADGLFTVPLDFGAQFAGQERFLEIDVRADSGLGCANPAGFVILAPRQALTAAPSALFALNSDFLDGLNSTAFLQSIPVPLTLSGTSATHIIRGENASAATFASGVHGMSTASTGITSGVYGQSASASARAVLGFASAFNGVNFGVYGESNSTSGRGVYGLANNAADGITYGGWFQSNSSLGIGVLGYASAGSGTTYGAAGQNDSTSGAGVYGYATSLSGVTDGVYGRSQSPSGRGVHGFAAVATGTASGGFFESASTSGRGVYGLTTAATGDARGVFGRSDSSEGAGIFGYATAASGPTTGVYGQSNSTSGIGVYGFGYDGVKGETNGTNGYGVWASATGTGGIGVFGRATALTGTTYGLRGDSASTGGRGVYGVASSATGFAYGVLGQTASTSGNGVVGQATAPNGSTYGVVGESWSTSGRGVLGYANATTGNTYGVHGLTSGDNGAGVVGQAISTSGTTYGVYGVSDSPAGRGVFGYTSAASGTTYGVLGQAAANLWAVFANGSMGASGLKPFRIDHPDDPSNKYLLHYAAESPEVINFYRGTVVLDGAGEATVELPPYFAKINKSPSYQLTAVGAPMPMLHVAEEIDEDALAQGAKAGPGETAPACSLRIAGGAPGAKVSWRVEALRNDRWVQQHGAPVEVEKQGIEMGTYQHPELYGQPAERGMNYRPEPERPSAALSNPDEIRSSGAPALK